MSPNVAMGRWPLRSAALKDPPSAQLLNRGAVVDDPVAPQRPQRRSLRSPELQRRPPNRNITKKEAGAPPRRPAQVEMRRARLFGDPRQGIKNTIRQPEMSERESMPLSLPARNVGGWLWRRPPTSPRGVPGPSRSNNREKEIRRGRIRCRRPRDRAARAISQHHRKLR